MRGNADVCNRCDQYKPVVIPREITPTQRVICCSDCSTELRAINNVSGSQARADEPPADNGVHTA